MLTIDNLKNFGANTDEGLARCFGNADFYIGLVKTLPLEQSFDKLNAAIAQGDLDTAFEMAHALKGVLGNLAITPIYEPVYELTELLRVKTEMDYTELVNKILSQRDFLAQLCSE